MGRAERTQEAEQVLSALYSKGFTQSDLARLAGVSRERVRQVFARDPLRFPPSIAGALSDILEGRVQSPRPVIGETAGTLVVKAVGPEHVTALCTRCGREVVVSRASYRMGAARCTHCSVMVVEDLSGRRVGALTVIAPVAGQRPVKWWVKCECGEVFTAWDHNLRYFRTTRCRACGLRARNPRARRRVIVPAAEESEALELAAKMSAEDEAIAEWERAATSQRRGSSCQPTCQV